MLTDNTLLQLQLKSLEQKLSSDLQVECNLDPDVDDVGQTGSPLSPFINGSMVDILVHINAGSVGVASLDIEVFYPLNILQAQNVTLSPLTSTNLFVNRISGVVALEGRLEYIVLY